MFPKELPKPTTKVLLTEKTLLNPGLDGHYRAHKSGCYQPSNGYISTGDKVYLIKGLLFQRQYECAVEIEKDCPIGIHLFVLGLDGMNRQLSPAYPVETEPSKRQFHR